MFSLQTKRARHLPRFNLLHIEAFHRLQKSTRCLTHHVRPDGVRDVSEGGEVRWRGGRVHDLAALVIKVVAVKLLNSKLQLCKNKTRLYNLVSWSITNGGERGPRL